MRGVAPPTIATREAHPSVVHGQRDDQQAAPAALDELAGDAAAEQAAEPRAWTVPDDDNVRVPVTRDLEDRVRGVRRAPHDCLDIGGRLRERAEPRLLGVRDVLLEVE